MKEKAVLENIKSVDEVVDFVDDEKGSCIDALIKIKKYPKAEITFCNGGRQKREHRNEFRD